MSRKYRFGFKLFAVVIIILVVFLVCGWVMFGTQIKAARTVTKLQEGLYSMEYKGDYGVEKLMERGGAANASELADYLVEFLSHGFYKSEQVNKEITYGCSTISAKTENGDPIFGRNYDWEDCSAMIIHTKPENGYESVSTACLDFLGFGDDWRPEGMSNQMMALAAIYVPLDGMNEKGLMVADLIAGDKEETHQESEKPDVTTTLAIRLMLDQCATVDEAIELLNKYDMNSDIGAAHHYSIADATGKSVVVEYINGEMVVTKADVVTNHYLSNCDKQGIGSEQSHDRYSVLCDRLQKSGGFMEASEIRDSLRSVSQGAYNDEYEKTVWSIVYQHSPEALMAEYYWNENYDSGYFIILKSAKDDWCTELSK